MATAKKAAPASKSTAVAKNTPGGAALAEANVPDFLAEAMVADAGAGLGHMQTSDYALPWLYLLQKMSPQLDVIEEAEAGMFINTVTNELYDELLLIPCEFEKVYNEWVPRDAGGGFVASYKTRVDAEQNKRDDTQIVDTANHYVLAKSADDTWSPAILSLTSTKLKASRTWNSRMRDVTIDTPSGKKPAPTFAKIYRVVKTGPHKAPKGNNGTYFSIEVQPVEGSEGWVQDAEVYTQAKLLFESINAGRKGADYTQGGETIIDADIDEDGEEEEQEEVAPKGKRPKF